MGLTSAHGAMVIDMVPYDGSLQRCVADLKGREGMPATTCAAIAWAGPMDDRRSIQQFLYRDIRNHIYVTSKEGRYKVPGLMDMPPAVADTTKPTICDDDFKLTKVAQDSELQMRQTVVDQWEANVDFQAAFKEMCAEHNKKHNPSGKTFKGNKRPAQGADATSVESRAVTLTSVKVAKEDLAKEGDFYETIGLETFYELRAAKGHLYLHAIGDGVVGDEHPICGIGAGEFVLKEEAQKVKAAEGSSQHLWLCCWSNSEGCCAADCALRLYPQVARCGVVPVHV